MILKVGGYASRYSFVLMFVILLCHLFAFALLHVLDKGSEGNTLPFLFT